MFFPFLNSKLRPAWEKDKNAHAVDHSLLVELSQRRASPCINGQSSFGGAMVRSVITAATSTQLGGIGRLHGGWKTMNTSTIVIIWHPSMNYGQFWHGL